QSRRFGQTSAISGRPLTADIWTNAALLRPILQGFAEALIARLVHWVIRAVHDPGIRERAGRAGAFGDRVDCIGLDGVVREACRLRLHPATTACSRAFAVGLSATQCR